MKRAVLTLAFILIAVAARAAEPGIMIPSASLFSYDNMQPLYASETVKEKRSNMIIYRIEYTSTNGLRVPGFFYVPTFKKQPLPCVIFLHGSGGSKADFTIVYEMLALRGFAVLAIDTALHGDREMPNLDPGRADWYQLRDMFAQTVVDLRRGVDWLQTRPEVDSGRIGFLGVSQGSLIGITFVAVEKRIRAAIFIVGGADFHVFLRYSGLPSLTILRNYATPDELDKIADDIAAVDPANYIAAIAPRPVMLANGRKDLIISEKAGMRLHELAGEPKEATWYDGSHIPPFDKVLIGGVKFLNKYLKKADSPAQPATPKYEKPSMKFAISRDNSDALNRKSTVTATTGKPLPAGVKLVINFPMISPANFPLFDDGTHGDAKAGDGTWTMAFSLGQYVPDLDIVGGAKLYNILLRAVAPDGSMISELEAGNLIDDNVKKEQ